MTMPVHAAELPTLDGSRSSLVERRDVSQPERRKRVRSRVHWQVHFPGAEQVGSVVSTTENLSSGGFCCLAPVAFTPGEIRTCALKVPAHQPNTSDRVFSLECRVRVIWVKPNAHDGLFVTGCEIQDYRFRPAGCGTVAYIDRLFSP